VSAEAILWPPRARVSVADRLRVVGRFVRNMTLAGLCLALGLSGLLVGTSLIVSAHEYHPKPIVLSRLEERSTVYTHDGLVIGTLGTRDRSSVPLGEVPQTLINAVVASEDRTFWANDGIDPGGMLRAFLSNARAGKVKEGGSTITQQLVKNRVLGNRRDLERKVKELTLAFRLNQKHSKRWILTEYLNTVYFGAGAYGVKSAAERIIGKPLSQLTVGESALLAGLVSSPASYDPFTNPDGARARRAEVLDLMVEERYVSRSEAKAAAAEALPAVAPPTDLRPRNYFVEEAQRRLLADPRLGSTEADRRRLLLTGGVHVYTTEDAGMQFLAAAAYLRVMPDQPPFTASMVVMDPTTGKVRAMVGGRAFDQSQYNLATRKPGRQTGSAFKAITLAAMLEAGYSPQALVSGASPCTVGRAGYPTWTTQNSEGAGGIMTVRDATAGSVNCAYARIVSAVGPDAVINMAHRLGIQQELPNYLPVTLGTGESTPLEMATVASTLAANGVRHQPVFVEKVVAADGTVLIDDSALPGEQVVSPDVAHCTVDVLRGVVARGTGTAAQLANQDVVGKTGTTDQKSDAWFLGMTPSLVGAVWMGAPEGRVPMTNVGGITVFGGTYPARLWHAFMEGALHSAAPASFPAGPLWCYTPPRPA
jgi:penicillin-binding protein 1A